VRRVANVTGYRACPGGIATEGGRQRLDGEPRFRLAPRRRVLAIGALGRIAVCAAFLTGPLAMILAGPVAAQVVGRGAAHTSDTLTVGGRTFQLHGIDGIEFHQFCLVDGRPWACGAPATRAFQTLLDAVVISCTPTGTASGGVPFAVCTSAEGDLADILVRQGWALAYRPQSTDYVTAEDMARAEGRGVWRGAFVEPWAYREDIAAIERRYAEQTRESLRTEAEEALLAGVGGLAAFDGAVFTRRTGGTAAAQEVRIPEIGAGFILGAIEARGVFTWDAVAVALEDWRRLSLMRVIDGLANSVWWALAGLPGVVVFADDAERYYAAMVANAAPLLAAGRQPILLVAGATNPYWLADWFAGAAPAGAEITIKPDPPAGYVGTISGIDVYAGTVPPAESLLFPSDLLVELAYVANAEGHILLGRVDEAPDPDELVLRYFAAITWRDEPIIHFHFPAAAARNPYDS
jgi:hypothetical protein